MPTNEMSISGRALNAQQQSKSKNKSFPIHAQSFISLQPFNAKIRNREQAGEK